MEQIRLNPVPPAESDLLGHWTMNSITSERYIPDISGRGNHVRLMGKGTIGSGNFVDHSPADDIINISGNRSYLRPTVDGGTGAIEIITDGIQEASGYPILNSELAVPTPPNEITLTFWVKPTTQSGHTDGWIAGRGATLIGWGAWGLEIKNTLGGQDGLEYETVLHYEPPASSWVPVPIDNTDTGWFGSTAPGSPTRGFKKDAWHFVVLKEIANASASNSIELYIYREGDGLLYRKHFTLDPSYLSSASNFHSLVVAGNVKTKIAGNFTSPELAFVARGAYGYYDEIRLFKTLLTPRNIKFLYLNPTGRFFSAPPAPGIGIKHDYHSFYDKADANTSLYIHGFDQDGNAADIPPWISQDGNILYINNEVLGSFTMSQVEYDKRTSNTAYIATTSTGSNPIAQSGKYYLAQPIPTDDSTGIHDWHGANNTNQWESYDSRPEGNRLMLIGEIHLAPDNRLAPIESVTTYQMSRLHEVVRETYNFTILPKDFAPISPFAANVDFWDSAEGIDSTYIKGLVAEKIQAGTISVGIHVGGEQKITLDGSNSRIVIKD